jgi:hypothetical protein
MATYFKTMNTNKGPLWTLAKDRTQTLRWWAKQKTIINIKVMSNSKRPQWTQTQWTFQQHLDSFGNNKSEDHKEHCTIESQWKYLNSLTRLTIGTFDCIMGWNGSTFCEQGTSTPIETWQCLLLFSNLQFLEQQQSHHYWFTSFISSQTLAIFRKVNSLKHNYVCFLHPSSLVMKVPMITI